MVKLDLLFAIIAGFTVAPFAASSLKLKAVSEGGVNMTSAGSGTLVGQILVAVIRYPLAVAN